MSVLETRHVTMRFGGLTAVDDLNIVIDEGEIVSLIGPNGAGKTTCFNVITGIYQPTEGEVFFYGEKLNGKRPDQVASIGISRTFQNIRLFKTMSVLDNVMCATHFNRRSGLFANILHLPNATKEEGVSREKAMKILEEVGLAQYADWKATSLPYGLQRRLEIARALISEPKLLLLDEPAAGMNPKESDELADFIFEIKDKFHITVFLIEHHMKLVMKISDRIYVTQYGKTIAMGTPEEIRNNPLVIQAYLGEEG
ncbi:MAG: ABC transporter ATP-binding protein [Erysipelotrichaceae bacterium]|nr:ABC transporter ATP-binding protein [Erysipelotrichaceae bacterium]